MLLATVRSLAPQTDEVQFFAVPLSAPREPLPTITPADVNLDDNGLRLATVGQEPRYEIPLTGNDQWAETFEREASTVLGTDYAPSALDDRRAVRLLIALARAGRRFADRLGDLGIGDAHTIAVSVPFNTPVLPLELAYDGVAPEEKATLCDCHRRPPPLPAKCNKASAAIVCPYAFWGMSWVIARTVKGRPAQVLVRPAPGPLSLRPILDGAARRADNGSPPDAVAPSQQLEDGLKNLFQVRPGDYERVRTWDNWRTKSAHVISPIVSGAWAYGIPPRGGHSNRGAVVASPGVDINGRCWYGPQTSPSDPGSFACDSAVAGDAFGSLPSAFIDKGAAAVIAAFTKFNGRQAARAAIETVSVLVGTTRTPGSLSAPHC